MTRMPWPLDDGGRIAQWQDLVSLERAWDVTLVVLASPLDLTLAIPEAVRAKTREVIRVPHQAPSAVPALVRGLLGRWPYTLGRWHSRALSEELRSVCARLRPQLCFFSNLHAATHLDVCRESTTVLRAQNAESEWMASFASSRRNPLVAAYARIQHGRLKDAERRLCESADLVLAIQPLERDLLRGLAPRARVECIPLGVDFARFEPRRPVSPPIVLLNGAFTWAPNVDGALRFLREGWPTLHQQAHAARLRIAGKQPPEELRRAAAAAGVELAADVPSMAAELARASVLVVPLWVGGGARVKIVEGLAASVPVVSTPLGTQGLELQPGMHVVEADEPAALAREVASLLHDPARANALARAGHAFAADRFDLGRVAERFVALCAEAVERRRVEGGSLP